MPRKKGTLLPLLSLATLSSAIVLPPATSSSSAGDSRDLVGASSARKSLNWGPHPQSDFRTADNPSPALRLWNAAAPAISLTSGDVVGKDLAKAFVDTLHPAAQFRLVDGYLSKHTNVFHAHFLQQVDGIDVANGNLNVNINLDTNEIISYGDSSFAAKSSATTKVNSWKDKVASWASGTVNMAAQAASQVVFGSQPADDGPQHQEDIDLLAEYSSPPLVPANIQHAVPIANDPRHGLLTFLAVQSSTTELTNVLLAAPRQRLVQRMTLAPHPEGKQHAHTIAAVPSALEPVKASLTYVHDGSKLRLAWKYEILTEDNQYEAYVEADNAVSGDEETLLVVDWVRDFRPTGGEMGIEAMQNVATYSSRRSLKGSLEGRKPKLVGLKEALFGEADVAFGSHNATPTYNVFPWGVNAPDVGKRQVLNGTAIELDEEASPAGWHTVPAEFKGGKDTVYFDTRGNNAIAQDNPDGGNSMNGYRPSGGANLTFDFPLGWPKSGTPLDPKSYIDAAVTQLFYTNNEIHDLFYRYGFDEQSGNFQEYNFGRGGQGGDAVQANAQDGSGTNNANFATPPDGSRPRMRMYYWTGGQPYRDGDFEAGIVIHEYAHGISTRLTGGPANSGCLGWGEAGGMGEGYGDALASIIRVHAKEESPLTMGEWASFRKGGIRNYPYSTNMTVNPTTYSTLDKPGYWGVHAIGEVWANMIHEINRNLVAKHGWNPTLFPPSNATAADADFYSPNYKKKVAKHGNTLTIQLLLDGMKLQPCRPSFQDARDAILTADKILTGGDNFCEIWKAFSKRGLGPNSKVVGSTPWGGGVRSEDASLPSKCKGGKKE